MKIEVLYEGTPLLVESVGWSGDVTQAARKLDIAFINTVDGRTQARRIENGRELRFLLDGRELFRGGIFTHKIDDRGFMTATAYDDNTYLTRNYDTRKFVNMTASAIVRRLCADFGIAVGTIAETGYVIPKLILRNKSIWEMMTIALTYSRKQTGRRFFIFSREGRLHLSERKEAVVRWVLENRRNITSASYSQSIEDMRTQVKVIGGDPEKAPVIATAKDDALIRRFGIMQHLENVDPDMTRSQVEQRAKQLLAELGTIDDDARIDALGNPDVVAGAAVYVRESMTGITGAYYVSVDDHTFANGKHTMSVSLSATDDLPTLEVEEATK
ncbi:XkdQ/YqbQ family protein [Brevibacillus panacihumi]|uniref:XkdQ/YqbQ family protein n=1 Tax=Brevibacillus panacihumi TaxID=497735 RepID=UPI003D023D8D